jgi:hypothetical protein
MLATGLESAAIQPEYFAEGDREYSLVRLQPFSRTRRDEGDEGSPRTSCCLSAFHVYTDIMSTDRDRNADGQSKLEQALAAVQAGDLDSARRQTVRS